jgi:hypothetical protein
MSEPLTPEREGWTDMTDREMLSYAWSVLARAEQVMPHHQDEGSVHEQGCVERAVAAARVAAPSDWEDCTVCGGDHWTLDHGPDDGAIE